MNQENIFYELLLWSLCWSASKNTWVLFWLFIKDWTAGSEFSISFFFPLWLDVLEIGKNLVSDENIGVLNCTILKVGIFDNQFPSHVEKTTSKSLTKESLLGNASREISTGIFSE